MELYKQSNKLFWKRKIIWIPLVAYNLWNMACIYWHMRQEFDIELLSHTREILLLCPQILVLYLILSYEFFSERYRTGLEESARTTAMGFGSKPVIAQAAVMVSVLLLNYLALTLFDLALTAASFQASGMKGWDQLAMAACYVCECLFVNVFLIGLIGVLLGMVLSKIEKRAIGYAAIMAAVLVTSYLLTEIATMVMALSDYSINLFSLLDVFNIMTPGLKFMPNSALGFPMMPYRVCLILFWNLTLLLILMIRDSQKKLSGKSLVCLVLCAAAFIGYVLPSSRVDMGLSSTGSAMADQHYYDIGNYRIGEREGGFAVQKYTMDLDVHRTLKAKVKMDVSESLGEYRFTLSHSYDVKKVTDSQGNPMEFHRDEDALLIDNRKAKTKSVIVEYSGANEAYYANSQGMNLHGSFPYYPMAGYRQITEDGMFMNQLFLEKDAEFDIKVSTEKTVYSNLEQDSRGHFVGKSNGATLVSGLYAKTERNGVEIVWPPLNGWGEEGLDIVTKAVKEGGYGNSKVFITPNMNRQDDAVSQEQIITRNCFDSMESLQDCYPEKAKGECR